MTAPDFAAIKAALAKTKASLVRAGSTIKPKAGANRYVIAPPWDASGRWSHVFAQHFIKDETDTLQGIYACVSETFGEPCDVCDALAGAQRAVGVHNPAVAELIKNSKAKGQFLVGVLALDTDKPNEVQVLQLGWNAYNDLVVLVEAWMAQVFDPTAPLIVQVTRTGTGMLDTKYSVMATPEKHPIKSGIKPIDLEKFSRQENDAAKTKAISAVRLIAGVNAAPRLAGAAKPADRPALATSAPAGKVANDQFEDVPDLDAPNPAAVALTEDIDALMADLPD